MTFYPKEDTVTFHRDLLQDLEDRLHWWDEGHSEPRAVAVAETARAIVKAVTG